MTGLLMSLLLFNSLSRKKERFTLDEKRSVKLYTCGPTVYDVAHIGNLRTYLFEDLLHRTLQFFGHEVEQVMNITDIDDKTIKGAMRSGLSLDEFTKPFKKRFFEDLSALNIAPARHYPEATAFIPQMIEMIEQLLKGGFAYKSDDQSIYFQVERFENYGSLARLVPDALRIGGSNRVELDEYDKKQACDFALWKAYDPKRDGEIFWPSPWGKGRPGWHIECSAMAHHFHGPTLDIHTGGVDNIFPHHENEIAQSQCSAHQPLARYWLHAQHLRVEKSKMSKSLGNVTHLSDLIERGFDPIAFRLLLLQNHYRTPINFTWESLKAAAGALQRLRALKKRLKRCAEQRIDVTEQRIDVTEQARSCSEKLMSRLQLGLADDLNSSAALAAVFDWARMINGQLDADCLQGGDAEHFLFCFQRLEQILGLFPQDQSGQLQSSHPVPDHLIKLVALREQARNERDWLQADQIRKEIEMAGYLLLDTPSGSIINRA